MECVATLEDGVCDQECYEMCPEEMTADCPHCNDGCPLFSVGDGICHKDCFTVECNFDTDGSHADCYFCGAECVALMGNGVCDSECYIGACNMDGGDCNGVQIFSHNTTPSPAKFGLLLFLKQILLTK